MKFGEKYELLESLTTGAIETFIANDKIRGERVLVHIVECTPQKPDQSTMQWVLECFGRVAPDPAGTVLEAGKYSGALYAYLVIKIPDDAAVKSWVRNYELQNQETQEIVALPVKTAELPHAGIPDNKPTSVASAPGSFPQLLRGLDTALTPDPKASNDGNAAGDLIPHMSLPGDSGLHAAPPWNSLSSRSSEMPNSNNSDPRYYEPASSPMPSPPPEDAIRGASAFKGESKAGEFTSFFQGPFRGDSPSAIPNLPAEPREAPRKQVGEFTAMFGQMGNRPVAPPAPVVESSGTDGQGGTFTKWFKDAPAPTPSTTFHSSTAPSISERSGFNEAPPLPLTERAAPPPVPLYVPQPVVANSPAVPPLIAAAPVTEIPLPEPLPSSRPEVSRSDSSGNGATHAFSRPGSDPPPAQAPVASGRSPYTQVISRAKLRAMSEAQPQVAGSADLRFPSMPAMAPPALPHLPTPPPMPAVPSPPPPPKIALPSAPQGPVSYWPLILILTVLFFIAVLLVLYFAMRH